MKRIEKRILELESVTPDKDYPLLGEHLEKERTPGTPENIEFEKIYEHESK